MKKLLNDLGISAVELVLALGMMGGLSVVVMNTIETQQSTSSKSAKTLEIESIVRRVSNGLKRKNTCNTVLAGNDLAALNGNSLDLSQLGVQKKAPGDNYVGVGLVNVELLNGTENTSTTAIDTTKRSEQISLAVKLTFTTNGPDSNELIYKVPMDLFVTETGAVECLSYNELSIKEQALEDSCVMAGGTFTGTDCEMNNIDADLALIIKKEFCEMIGGGQDVDGNLKCKGINLTGSITSLNLSENKVCLSGNCRTQFDNTSCGGGSYLTSVAIGGAKNCTGLSAPTGTKVGGTTECSLPSVFSLGGDNSSASASKECNETVYDKSDKTCATTSNKKVTIGECKRFSSGTCNGGLVGIVENFEDGTSCGSGKVCKSGSCESSVTPTCVKPAEYSITGNNIASESKSCWKLEYDSSDGSCETKSSSPDSSAGLCKRYKAGSCSGNAIGTIENFADGTSCGTNKECQSGACEDKSSGPICNGGVAHTNKSTCEDGGKYDCSISFIIRYVGSAVALCKDISDDPGCNEVFCRGAELKEFSCPGGGSSFINKNSCKAGGKYNCSFSEKVKDLNGKFYLCTSSGDSSCYDRFCRASTINYEYKKVGGSGPCSSGYSLSACSNFYGRECSSPGEVVNCRESSSSCSSPVGGFRKETYECKVSN
jgi:hypothetical protein